MVLRNIGHILKLIDEKILENRFGSFGEIYRNFPNPVKKRRHYILKRILKS